MGPPKGGDESYNRFFSRAAHSVLPRYLETLQRDLDNSLGMIDGPVIMSALDVIHRGSRDTKNTHVRLASLNALEALLLRLESLQEFDTRK